MKHRRVSKWMLNSLFAVVVLVSGYFIWPGSRVASITVTGTQTLTPAAVAAYSGFRENQTVLEAQWFIDDATERLQSKFPQIAGIHVTFSSGNQLELAVTEHPIVAYVETAEATYPIVANGYVVKESAISTLGSVPLLRGFDDEERRNVFFQQFSQVTPEIRNTIAEVVRQNDESKPYLTTLYMQDGNQVLLHYDAFFEKLNYYRGMLQEIGTQRGVVDLTIGAYFTPYSD